MLVLGALAASGCGVVATRAQAPIERPELDVPPAPPRIIEPAPMPAVAAAIEPVSDLPPPPADPKPIRRSPKEAPRDTQKPEPKPETVPPVEITPPPAPAAQPAPQLRTPATADAAAAEQRTRDTINRAQGMLENVNYQRLSPERRKSYDDAKEFIKSSEGLIKTLNFELANEMAEKAEKLAKALQGG
jgi:hypothetical protein